MLDPMQMVLLEKIEDLFHPYDLVQYTEHSNRLLKYLFCFDKKQIQCIIIHLG